MSERAIVIGAGPGGLAAAGALKARGVSALVLDGAPAVGQRWRDHYERLHLHTTRRGSALPYRPFPSDWPRYPSRAQVVEYLDEYARSFELAPKLGEAVTRARAATATAGTSRHPAARTTRRTS